MTSKTKPLQKTSRNGIQRIEKAGGRIAVDDRTRTQKSHLGVR